MGLINYSQNLLFYFFYVGLGFITFFLKIGRNQIVCVNWRSIDTGRMRNLNEIGELGISVDNQSMNLKNTQINKCSHRNYYCYYLKREREGIYLVLNLVFLGFLERNVIFGETSLALPVLKQYEPDLQHSISNTQTKRRESFRNNF